MSAQFWVFLALDSWWLNFMTDFFFLRYCYSDLSEIHVHPFDDKSFVKFIIHIDSFPIQSSIQLMFINLIMLCKKVSDIWQYITVRTAAGSMGARAVQIVQNVQNVQNVQIVHPKPNSPSLNFWMIKTAQSNFKLLFFCIVLTLWHKVTPKTNGHQRSTSNYNFVIATADDFKMKKSILISYYCLLLRHDWAWILGEKEIFFFFALQHCCWIVGQPSFFYSVYP